MQENRWLGSLSRSCRHYDVGRWHRRCIRHLCPQYGPNVICSLERWWHPGNLHGSGKIKEPLEQVVWQAGPAKSFPALLRTQMRAFQRISPISLRRSFSPGEMFWCLKKSSLLWIIKHCTISKKFSPFRWRLRVVYFHTRPVLSQSLLNSFSLRWRRKGMLECLWFFFIRSEIQLSTVNGERVHLEADKEGGLALCRGHQSGRKAVNTGCFLTKSLVFTSPCPAPASL